MSLKHANLHLKIAGDHLIILKVVHFCRNLTPFFAFADFVFNLRDFTDFFTNCFKNVVLFP
jgi:hypothetical protein